MKTSDGCEFTRDGTKRRETSRRRTGGTSTLAGEEREREVGREREREGERERWMCILSMGRNGSRSGQHS